MTDQRARAEQHVEKRMNALLLYQELLTDSPPDAVTRIVAALADERRRVLEEAAKLMCSYCNDPQWPRSAIVQGQAVHVGPITGSLFPCNAMQIHAAIRKAHAGQEG